VIKLRRVRWVEHMHGGEQKCIQGLVRKLEGTDHLKILGIDRRIILKLILHKQDGRV
jgi:hypothetical protein